MIEVPGDLSLRRQCALLKLSRSRVLYRPREVSEQETCLMQAIGQIWEEIPTYGYRKVREELVRRGFLVNRKRVQRLMRVLDLKALYPKKRTSVPSPGHPIYPYLLRGVEVSRPNQVWSTDITYLRLRGGFVYVAGLMDVYSRKIMAWRLSISLEADFCHEMLEEALLCGTPEIVNTDQGSQFTSPTWTGRVMAAGARVSMDGKGRWADNIPVERFWRTLKHEHVFLMSYETVAQARQSVTEFVAFYNRRRVHQSLNYATPDEVFAGVRKAPAFVFGRTKAVDNRENALAFPLLSTAQQHL